MLFSDSLNKKTQKLVASATKAGLKIATAESCTGGLISSLLTSISGASEVFDRTIVTYSNQAKIEQLTVPTYFMSEFGAVSAETALAMAEGLLLISQCDLALSTTGIAGPSGGSEEKPVGTVHIALARKQGETCHQHFTFKGSRTEVRLMAVEAAIDLFQQAVDCQN